MKASVPNMIGRVIDRAMLQPLFPGWALKREAARQRYDLLCSFAAGKRDRTTADFNPKPKSADAALIPSRELMNSRARQLALDSAHGAAVRRAFERHVVGTGISPAPIVKNREGELMEEFNTAALNLFNDWASAPEACDFLGRQSWWARQRMAIGEAVEVGEHFIHRAVRQSPDPALPGLVLQSFEPEQLDTSISTYRQTGNEVRAGIEIDRDGRIIAYHFRRDHPYDIGHSFPRGITGGRAAGELTIRILADRIDHLFDQRRVRQSHGITRYHAAINRLRDHGFYDEATLMAARMEACIGVLESLKEDDGASQLAGLGGATTDDGEDAHGNAEINFQPGMFYQGRGELKPFVPTRPGNQYGPFTEQQLRAIGAATGLGYGQVSMDFTKGTYSGQRQELLEMYAETDVLQLQMIEMTCEPVWRDFIRVSVLSGLLPVSVAEFKASPRRFCKADWRGPARQWIDPEKEARAAEAEIALGLNSRKRILNAKGTTPREVFSELGEENRLAQQESIDVSPPRGGGSSSGQGDSSGDSSGDRKRDRDEQDQEQDRIVEPRVPGHAPNRLAARNGASMNGAHR